MTLLIKKTFVEKIKILPKGPSSDFFLSLIGENLNNLDEIDYYLVVYQMLSKLDKNNGKFLVKYIRRCLEKGYDKTLFFHAVWLAYIGNKKKLLLIFANKEKYSFFYRYYIGLLLNLIKN